MVSRKFKRLSVIIIYIFLILFISNCVPPTNKCIIESCQIIDDTIIIIIQPNGIRLDDFTEIKIGKYNFYDKRKIDEESLLASGENNLHGSGEINQKKSKEKSHYQF